MLVESKHFFMYIRTVISVLDVVSLLHEITSNCINVSVFCLLTPRQFSLPVY
jgi:hypothetical protein